MQDTELCKGLLERIFPDMKIDHIEYPTLQKTINPDIDAKSVRLDVYVMDGEGAVYDIEMQMTDTKELPKRTRYYQAMMDLEMIDMGESYKKLKKSFVIFICPFDLFGKRRHIYTFRNYCGEDREILLGDDTAKIFLNMESRMEDVNKDLRAFLDYVAGRKPEDSYVQRLAEVVERAKRNRKWRHEYMTMLMREQESFERGKTLGIEQGVEQEETRMILRLHESGYMAEQIADLLGKEIKKVEMVIKKKGMNL
ncbi:MAG: Rpn family recombination-promoting nuclease/putative transposase [Lachnospiraceae bacterium]|nr:Rpn family recombination-promoting nuclease/putative transposase [Lachnospiraceae bacterium]